MPSILQKRMKKFKGTPVYSDDQYVRFNPEGRVGSIVRRVSAERVVMRRRVVCFLDCVGVQYTPGSTFSKNVRASFCRDHAPDPNRKTNPYPNPNHRDVDTSMQPEKHAVLERTTGPPTSKYSVPSPARNAGIKANQQQSTLW